MEKKWDYCYPSGLEKALCKWDTYVPLVTKGLKVKDRNTSCLLYEFCVTVVIFLNTIRILLADKW